MSTPGPSVLPPRRQWSRRTVTLIGVAVFAVAFCVRFGAIDGLGGDDHWSLWNASAFLHGDLPYRGFVDMGNPLHWFVSAVAQWAVGYRIVGEVLLGSLLSAVALTLAFFLAWEASDSLPVALGVTLLALTEVTVAKLYSYPKIFVYPLGLWAAWRYIDRPTRWRALGLAAAVIVAFGYRHDHGAYVGVACTVAVCVAHWDGGVLRLWMPLVRFVLLGTLLVGPYLLWIQMNEGLPSYLRERATFAQKLDEAGRRAVPWVVDPEAPPGWIAVVPPPPVRIAVAWASGTSRSEQNRLERQYGLAPQPPSSNEWIPYIITDLADANLRALMADTRVGRVDGVVGSFRLKFRPLERVEEPSVDFLLDAAVSAPERLEIEQRYGLRAGIPLPTNPRFWTYRLGDTSSTTLMALATDRRISQLGGLERVIDPVVVGVRERFLGAPMGLRWRDDLSDADRRAREARYQLLDPVPNGNSWRYQLADRSTENITALASDPGVEDTDGISGVDSTGQRRLLEDRPAGGRVRILWAGAPPVETRQALESEYHLLPQAAPTAFVPYVLQNVAQANVKALMTDTRVERTSGLDGATLGPEHESWLTAYGRAHRWARTRIWPRIVHERNAGVLLYYVAYGLPFLMIAALLLPFGDGPGMAAERGKMLVAGVMGAIISLALFRKLGYFPDHADVTAVLVAWSAARLWRSKPATAHRSVRVGLAAVAGLLVFAVYLFVDVPLVLARTGLDKGVGVFAERTLTRARAMAASPPIDYYAPPDAAGDRALIRYFHDCTRPDDRIWVTSDVYTIPYYAERRFVSHIFWGMGFMASDEAQQRTIELLEREPVPLIFGVGGSRPFEFLEAYPKVHDYVVRRYSGTHAILQDELNREGRVLWLAVDGRRTPTGTSAALGLPCFQ